MLAFIDSLPPSVDYALILVLLAFAVYALKRRKV